MMKQASWVSQHQPNIVSIMATVQQEINTGSSVPYLFGFILRHPIILHAHDRNVPGSAPGFRRTRGVGPT